MNAVLKLADSLPEGIKEYIVNNSHTIREVRMRIGRPLQVISDVDKLLGDNLTPDFLKNIVDLYTDYSLYTQEEEIRNGFFTLKDGSRVGVCGRVTFEDGKIKNLANIGSLSVRVAREVKGCAEDLIPEIFLDGKTFSVLVFSAPGFGKTTLLRDIARLLSDSGLKIAVVDERHEIAACLQGVPTMDVGARTDVLDGCPKYIAIKQLIRTMSPQVIITDEIGDARDAQAILDAARCGVSIIASAHAPDFDSLNRRMSISRLLQEGVFELAVQLSGMPGVVTAIRRCIVKQKGVGFDWECV